MKRYIILAFTLIVLMIASCAPAAANNIEQHLYWYRGTVANVYDGDTATISLDLGLSVWKINETIRFYGIDAPEVRGIERQQGLAVRDWLRAKLPVGQEVYVHTYLDKEGKYGRLLADVFLPDAKQSLNQEMLNQGLVLKYE